MNTLELIIFIVLLLDALGAVAISWFGANWYLHHFRNITRAFPPAKGWSIYYLVLVLVIGYLLMLIGS